MTDAIVCDGVYRPTLAVCSLPEAQGVGCPDWVGSPRSMPEEAAAAPVARDSAGSVIGPTANDWLVPRYSVQTAAQTTNDRFRRQLSFNRQT